MSTPIQYHLPEFFNIQGGIQDTNTFSKIASNWYLKSILIIRGLQSDITALNSCKMLESIPTSTDLILVSSDRSSYSDGGLLYTYIDPRDHC